MEKMEIGLSEEARAGLARLLSAVLADNVALSMMTRNAHWNVVGPDFPALHEMFGAQYGQLEEAGDDIAERIRALGGTAPGSLAEMLAATRLTELSGELHRGGRFAEALLDAHEAVCRGLREAITECEETWHDPATTDFLTGLLESHEKTAWMLRAYLA